MKSFLYTSETPCHTVLSVNGKATQCSLFKGEIYELPENDKLVKTLVYKGVLIIQKTSKKK